MENASKALLIAGGVLIALLVVSLAVLAFNQMSNYQRSQSDLDKVEQLADFNEQFTQYVRDDLNGIDLVTLANKVVDYNQKTSGPGEIDYNQKITLIINMNDYSKRFTEGDVFGKEKTYEVKNKNSYFFKTIKTYTGLETEYGLKTISSLSSNINSLKEYYTGDKSSTSARSIKDVTGKNIPKLEEKLKNGNFDEIEKYHEYSEFKTAEFKGDNPEFKNGQISKLTFGYIGNK